MRKTVGYFTLLAAVVLIVCSASTLFWSAYDGAVDPWQKWIQGVQIVAVIIWEAGAVLAITYCFSHGHKIMGYAGTVLLVLAMGYSLSEELRQQAGAQETAVAKRTAENGKLELVRSELDKAIARRDDLQKLRKLNAGQQNELATVRREIAGLKDKWEAQIETPHAVVAPGVALIARWTKLNVTDSADLNPLIKMAFWTMARVFALPIAVFGISLLGVATLTVQASVAPRGMQVAPYVSSPVAHRVARSELTPRIDLSRKTIAETPPQPPRPDDTPPPGDVKLSTSNIEDSHDGDKQSISKIATARDSAGPRIVINNDTDGHEKQRHIISLERGKKKTNGLGNVKEWLSECTSQTPDRRVKTTSKECHQSYRAWCEIGGWHPVGQQDLARKMSAILGRPTKTKGNAKNGRAPRDGAGRVWPGLLVYSPSATPLRATA